MGVVVVCGLLLLTGLAAGVAWNGRTFRAPEPQDAPAAGEVARRFAWYASLTIVAGIAAGILVIGAGGRLAMRLLAVTAASDAQGRLTEAEEVVGRITVGGTISFVVFNGIFGGVTAAAAYLVVRRFLPPGRLGGAVFGLGLLVVLGTTIDPLRKGNVDFDIVGPGWLAVVVFTAMAVAFGTTLASITSRLSDWLPLPSTERRVMVRYAPAAALAAVGFTMTALLAIVGLVVVGVTRWHPVLAAVRSPRTLVAGRVLILGLTLAFLPNAVVSVADIAGRP